MEFVAVGQEYLILAIFLSLSEEPVTVCLVSRIPLYYTCEQKQIWSSLSMILYDHHDVGMNHSRLSMYYGCLICLLKPFVYFLPQT